MKKFRVSLAILAVTFAVAAVFAFRARTPKPATHPLVDYIWIKYDCQTNPAVQTFPTSPNFQQNTGTLSTTGNFTLCTGPGNICAYRFLPSEVEVIDANNKRPKTGVSLVGRVAARCE